MLKQLFIQARNFIKIHLPLVIVLLSLFLFHPLFGKEFNLLCFLLFAFMLALLRLDKYYIGILIASPPYHTVLSRFSIEKSVSFFLNQKKNSLFFFFTPRKKVSQLAPNNIVRTCFASFQRSFNVVSSWKEQLFLGADRDHYVNVPTS